MSKFKFLYFTTIFSLFLYSFTQIDLGLAFTRFPFLFSIQRAFQTVGYFNRPLSAILFILILGFMTFNYFYILKLVKNGKLSKKKFWFFCLLTTCILIFSYNAFSYDFFNYIFDAKIVAYYGDNPYLQKALDYPGDPMLSFMHWTHRTYPYGPVWLAATVPLSFIAMNKFLLAFILFKLLAAGSFLGSIYFLEKIMEKINPTKSLLVVSFFAFNPLVLIESLVSAHIDIFMMFLSLISIYFLVYKKYLLMILFLALSIGVKFATVFLLPVILAIVTMQIMKLKVPWSLFFGTAVACLFVGVVAQAQTSGNFQPWYLLLVLPFIALESDNPFFFSIGTVASIGVLLTYLPYIYLGNWDKPVPEILFWLYVITGLLAVTIPLIYNSLIRKVHILSPYFSKK